jgi:acyl-CoA reductase-like NAD-dependent aldehyde dehydrogenase
MVKATPDLTGYRRPISAALLAAANDRPRRHKLSERIETLKKARERMVEDRDAFAKVLAAPFDRDKAERARVKFTEIQALIDSIDRAVAGEKL